MLSLLVANTAFNAPAALIPQHAAARVARPAVRMCDAAEADEETWTGAAKWSEAIKDPETVFPIERVKEILPHRYPFLLVDKVIEFEAGKRAVGVKKVSRTDQPDRLLQQCQRRGVGALRGVPSQS